MSRHVRSHQDVPPPAGVTQPGSGAKEEKPDQEPVEAKPEPFVRFLRNAGPVTPTIKLKDGTVIDFPTFTSKVLAPEDELVEKIRAVAGDYQLHEESNIN